MDAGGVGGAGENTLEHEVIQMRDRLAEGESELVGVELAVEQRRHDLDGGAPVTGDLEPRDPAGWW